MILVNDFFSNIFYFLFSGNSSKVANPLKQRLSATKKYLKFFLFFLFFSAFFHFVEKSGAIYHMFFNVHLRNTHFYFKKALKPTKKHFLAILVI